MYDPDVALSLVWGHQRQAGRSSADRDDRTEPWSTTGGFPDPAVHYTFAKLRWHGQPVDQTGLVLVDGARCYLPAPTPRNPTATSGRPDPSRTTYHVTTWQRDLARLVDHLNGHHDFDSYLQRSGFSTDPSTE